MLTEPTEFHGELAHLADAAELLAGERRPAMRKDFLTDPYQVLEARAAGAGGVLVIVAMLDDATVRALVDCARRCGMFVLLEAFDRTDLERLAAYDRPHAGAARRSFSPASIAATCATLQSSSSASPSSPRICRGICRPSPRAVSAPSRTSKPSSRRAISFALVGSSLMRAADPAALLAAWLAAGRAAVARRQARCS